MTVNITAPLAPVSHPYERRVTVQRNRRAMYNFLLTLKGWSLGTDLVSVADSIVRTMNASAAGAMIVASTSTVLWLDVEEDARPEDYNPDEQWDGHATKGACAGECDWHGV